VTGYNTLNGSGRVFYYRIVIGGTADPNSPPFAGSEAPPRNQAVHNTYVRTGVAAGSIICKLQCQADSGINESNYVTYARILAEAFTE
jgi:hypothetical protein